MPAADMPSDAEEVLRRILDDDVRRPGHPRLPDLLHQVLEVRAVARELASEKPMQPRGVLGEYRHPDFSLLRAIWLLLRHGPVPRTSTPNSGEKSPTGDWLQEINLRSTGATHLTQRQEGQCGSSARGESRANRFPSWTYGSFGAGRA